MNVRSAPSKAGIWYNPDDGYEIAHPELIKRCVEAKVVLLGEQHDRSAQHRWQLHVASGILAHKGNILMGFEMFPKRSNPILAEWVSGELTEAEFLDKVEWKKVWGFDPELYLPLFRFCREFRIPMIGLNCRRALVTEVGKQGWNAIPEDERDDLTPAKPASLDYRKWLFGLVGSQGPARSATGPEDPKLDRFVNAQQVWDRSFACRIAEALDQPEPPLVIGIIGSGHLRHRHGTPYQLEDLGHFGSIVLLPDDQNKELEPGVANAVFYLDPAPVEEVKATNEYIVNARAREAEKRENV
ncbi:MAG: ChaN family lipoprotein [Pseudomonadota bacterium]